VALFQRSIRTATLAAAIGAVLALTACGGDDPFEDGSTPGPSGSGGSAPAGGQLTIGGANFTEMAIMQEIYAALLTQAGYTVSVLSVDNREQYEPSLESGELDIVPDYAATLTEYLNVQVNGEGAELVASSNINSTIARLRELAEPRGLAVLEPAEAADQNAFFVTLRFAQEHDLQTLSDLAALGQPVVLAATTECPERPFCQIGLEETYGLEISEVIPLGYGSIETKQSVQSDESQLGLGGTTDATLAAEGFVVLEDDLNLQLADNLTPVVNAETLAEHPDIETILNELSAVLTTEILAELNQAVDVSREQARDVAEEFLVDAGLLDG
jgi:osmoprotectant transport system substrate-binding protein